MDRRRTHPVFALMLPVLLWALALPAWASVTVKNTSTYAGGGRWDWSVFVEADAATLRQIECVQYRLHPTFPNPVHNVCGRADTRFALSASGWGAFTIDVEVRYRDGRVQALQHRLVLEQAPAQRALGVTAQNWSKELEPGWWEWGVSVDGPADDLAQIRCVEYTLHPTFPNPVRVVCSRNDRFLLTARGWGTFTVGVKLMLKDGSTRELKHDLRF